MLSWRLDGTGSTILRERYRIYWLLAVALGRLEGTMVHSSLSTLAHTLERRERRPVQTPDTFAGGVGAVVHPPSVGAASSGSASDWVFYFCILLGRVVH